MALSATHSTSLSGGGAEVQTVTTGAFTPGANSLLCLFVFADSTTTGIDLTVTANTGGLTFTQQLQTAQSNFDTEFQRAALWTAPVGGSPGSMTITIDAGASTKTAFMGYGVSYMSDGSGNPPQIKAGQIIGNSENDAGGNTETHTSGTLPAAATSGNLTAFNMGVQNDATGAMTGPSSGGFSLLYDTAATATFAAGGCATSTTFTGTSSSFVDLGNSINSSHSILVEFEAGAAGAATFTGDIRWDYRSPILRM